MGPKFVLTLRCADRVGVFAAVTDFLARRGCAIIEAHQHQQHGLLFMRLAFDGPAGVNVDDYRCDFAQLAADSNADAVFHDLSVKPRLLLLVSRFGHCLENLLHRWRAGQLRAEIIGVVSNHEDMRSFVEWMGLPYHYRPVGKDTKEAQENEILDLMERNQGDLVVLARYMQILSPRLCEALSGRCINIHHSFLPSFKGAKPYHQAHARGVKIIGATAHYVTTDLDEGPIIEQDTRRVSHARTAEELVVIGQEVEASVLMRAVRWHIDHRVMTNGSQTIVFD